MQLGQLVVAQLLLLLSRLIFHLKYMGDCNPLCALGYMYINQSLQKHYAVLALKIRLL